MGNQLHLAGAGRENKLFKEIQDNEEEKDKEEDDNNKAEERDNNFTQDVKV